MINLVSVSGGKDSTATLLLAIERNAENLQAVFCDTGNEHPLTYEYVDYLEQSTAIVITRLKQDFSEWWLKRIDYIKNKWPEKGVSEEIINDALSIYEMGPTHNPFLDLCIIKNRFPSRVAQFCTQYLKIEPMVSYALDLMDSNQDSLTSWQGVRADESPNRAKLSEHEDRGGGYFIYRPIHQWTVEQVFNQHAKHGIKPNPLYLQGMNRVGCMPCINCSKSELHEISKRFPDQIDRIERWEKLVGKASKMKNATFFPSPGENETAYDRGNIRQQVAWSHTSRGGKSYDLFKLFDDDIETCSSSYGLCE